MAEQVEDTYDALPDEELALVDKECEPHCMPIACPLIIPLMLFQHGRMLSLYQIVKCGFCWRHICQKNGLSTQTTCLLPSLRGQWTTYLDLELE